MDSSGIVVALVACGVPLCLWCLKKSQWMRAAPPPPGAPDIKTLQARLGNWPLIEAAVVIIAAGSATFVWFQILRVIHAATQPRVADSQQVLYLAPFTMLAPGMALGLASSVPLGMGIMRLFLREKYADYAQFGERLYGLRANRVGVFLGALMAVPSLIFMVLAADCFAARTENHIVISRFWSLGAERRSYADVREVRAVESFRAPNGKIVRRPFHEIEFIDGSVWSPKQLGRDPEKAEEIEFVRLIAVRSGKSIVRHLIRPE